MASMSSAPWIVVDLNSIQLGDYATDVLHGCPAPAKPSALKGITRIVRFSRSDVSTRCQAARGRPWIRRHACAAASWTIAS